MKLTYFLFFVILLFNFSISIKLKVKKREKTSENISPLNLRFLNDLNYSNYSTIKLSILKLPIYLYTVEINIGEPKQKFSLIIDTGSSILWVYDKQCEKCKSKNKYVPSDSKTFKSNDETFNQNYVSGSLKGKLCQDNMYFNKQFIIPMFYFLVIYESNIDFELDGIIGLSRGSFTNKKYSFLNQIKEKNIVKEDFILYDFYNKMIYVSEIPSYFYNLKNITCFDDDYYSNFWQCEISGITFNDIPININNKIIFDSGTNGVVFPLIYLDYFNDIISNNDLFVKNKCNFESYEGIYKLFCNKRIDTNNLYLNNQSFVEFFFDKEISISNNNSFGFKIIDLLEEDNKGFKLYLFDKKDEILLGSPIFEKYPILFNKDNDSITIFGEGNILNNTNKNYYDYDYDNIINIVIIIIIIMILIFLTVFIVRKQLFIKNRIIKNGEIEMVSEI